MPSPRRGSAGRPTKTTHPDTTFASTGYDDAQVATALELSEGLPARALKLLGSSEELELRSHMVAQAEEFVAEGGNLYVPVSTA
jgi:hypothetical protein